MTLSFDFFEIETNWDFVRVYDGASKHAPHIATFTGATCDYVKNIPNIQSSSENLLLEFHVLDDIGQMKGIEFEWGKL